MTKTAVGLFENSGLVDGVVRDLESNPHTDIEVDLTHMSRTTRKANREKHLNKSEKLK